MIVVSSDAMRILESTTPEQELIDKAGTAIAEVILRRYVFCSDKKKIVLLVGRGNNGADAYAAGIILLTKGIAVTAYALANPKPHCLENQKRFEKAHGSVQIVDRTQTFDFSEDMILVDGLLGTGAKRAMDPLMQQLIESANFSACQIVSIDLPSGICPDTGTLFGDPICATVTVFLQYPKLGCFLKSNLKYVGSLEKGDLGFDHVEVAKKADWKTNIDVSLPKLDCVLHKYSAGYLVVFSGSYSMMGAAALCSLAALRMGAGIVRVFHSPFESRLYHSLPHEVICEEFCEERVLEELKKASAVVMGPGFGRDKQSQKILKYLISTVKVPCVIDGDALFTLAECTSLDIPKNSILTPHTGEMERILKAHHLEKEGLFFGTQTFVDRMGIRVLLKGVPNFLFEPNQTPKILLVGNPGMATAGSGDVLSGMIGSLLAQHFGLGDATIKGCGLHGQAGDLAAEKKSKRAVIASDLIEAFKF